jgi:septum formation protein
MDLLMVGELILASSSQVRQEMLSKANIPFVSIKPNIDEAEVKLSLLMESYSPRDIADALAELKASKISSKHPNSLVLGLRSSFGIRGCSVRKTAVKKYSSRPVIKIIRKTAYSIFSRCDI